MLHEGVIGEVLMSKAWDVQFRGNIGRAEPSSPPEHVHYDDWVGPAEFVPFQTNRFHYTWHWWFNFGTGDVATMASTKSITRGGGWGWKRIRRGFRPLGASIFTTTTSSFRIR